ncbi:MAG TPA: hypothetical protein VII94_00985 [Candidatus Saccharimonadales bacterium]
MTKYGPRPVVFVCISDNPDKPNDFLSKVIRAVSQEEAASLFLEQTKVKVKTIHGPFRPKRAQVIENTRTIKFADQQHKAVYNDWEVNAFMLKKPEDSAYLVFIKRVDGNIQQPIPKSIVVSVSELRIL